MDTAKVFTHGRSQAVRLPKAYRFDSDEVIVSKLGDLVVLCPRESGWRPLLDSIDQFTEDFMEDRQQPNTPTSAAAEARAGQ